MILVVKNIEHRVNETELKLLFNPYGEVIETNIMYDTVTWESKGFAIVEMKHSKDAIAAMEKLNGVRLHGKPLIVKKAHTIEYKA